MSVGGHLDDDDDAAASDMEGPGAEADADEVPQPGGPAKRGDLGIRLAL